MLYVYRYYKRIRKKHFRCCGGIIKKDVPAMNIGDVVRVSGGGYIIKDDGELHMKAANGLAVYMGDVDLAQEHESPNVFSLPKVLGKYIVFHDTYNEGKEKFIFYWKRDDEWNGELWTHQWVKELMIEFQEQQ